MNFFQRIQKFFGNFFEKRRTRRVLAEIAEVYAKAKRSGLVEVVEKNEHALLLRVKNYTGSRRFGSQKWCISYSIKHWKQYVTKSRKQYFLWTARGIGAETLVGFTLRVRSSFEEFDCCFDRNNNATDLTRLTALLKYSKLDFNFKSSAFYFIRDEESAKRIVQYKKRR